jgi:hypothetical protein
LRLLKTRHALVAMVFIAWLCASLVDAPAATPLLMRSLQDAQQTRAAEKKSKKRALKWNPPNVDVPAGSLSAAPPCRLPQVLALAGARVTEMVNNLQNFTATEKIEYKLLDDSQHGDFPKRDLQDGGKGTFDYLVTIDPKAKLSVQETRTPTKGTGDFPASSEDKGLPEMALIFLPRLQGDYNMDCEGMGEWNGKPAWVVQFRQRKDMPAETLLFADRNAVYAAQLKGRGWIAADSGEVIHLETPLMAGIPEMEVRTWSLSIDYAPVQFHSQDVTIWLPQTVDAYCELQRSRRIVYHDFSNFQLFSVQTKQVIDKPND